MKTKSSKTKTTSGTKTKTKSGKKARAAERAAKREARKGDGSFPDIVVVTKELTDEGKPYFLAHNGATLKTLYKDGETIGVYKLRRVSTITINRKIAR
jgi:hypothetical protein